MNDVLRDERERGWFHLDNAIIDEYLPRIGVTAFAVYACIVRHSDRAGNAFPSYSLLRKELGTGRTQIADAIKKLVAAGLVTITTGKRLSNVYHVVTVSTSPAEKLVPNRDQSRRETSTSPAKRPVLVPDRDSNNTQGTRHKEQDPLGVASQPRARETLAAFQPNARQIEDAEGYGVPFERIPFETEQWRDYHAEKGTPIKDLAASWRRWMRNAPAFERPRGSPPSSNGHRPVTFDEQREINNAKSSAEFLAIFDGSNDSGPAAVQRPDEPPRRGLPARHLDGDARRVLPGVPKEPVR